MRKICYNCGISLSSDNATVEHVPAKNLYDGFGDKFKLNRITVPACLVCNNLYSKIDQEIRDALAIKNNDPNQKQRLTGKGVRSILRRSNWIKRTQFNNHGKIIAVDFSYNDLRQIHLKNFKALFFKKYGFPVPKVFEIEIIADGDEDKIESVRSLNDYLLIDKEFNYSGHSDIFKYILKDISIDKNGNSSIFESGDFDLIIAVVGLLIYHNEIATIVLAGKKEFIENCKP